MVILPAESIPSRSVPATAERLPPPAGLKFADFPTIPVLRVGQVIIHGALLKQLRVAGRAKIVWGLAAAVSPIAPPAVTHGQMPTGNPAVTKMKYAGYTVVP
ncbi:TPA: hypothetical protein DEP31_00660 [Candidatus Azambacteria bacterium]|nr:hypothetical protein [Candidatus Azambacteria bacterium]